MEGTGEDSAASIGHWRATCAGCCISHRLWVQGVQVVTVDSYVEINVPPHCPLTAASHLLLLLQVPRWSLWQAAAAAAKPG
jgi:hypothetical protein